MTPQLARAFRDSARTVDDWTQIICGFLRIGVMLPEQAEALRAALAAYDAREGRSGEKTKRQPETISARQVQAQAHLGSAAHFPPDEVEEASAGEQAPSA